MKREPKGPAGISLENFVRAWEQRLRGQNGTGRASFRQTVQPLLLPSAGASLTSFVLPTSLPAEDEAAKEKQKAATTKAVAQAAQNQAMATAPPAVAAALQAQWARGRDRPDT